MKNKDFKNYFLGLLSAEDAESLELRLISDVEPEAELLQAENNLIEDYLDKNLTSEELKAFNANFLVTEERRKRVAFIEMMRNFSQKTVSEPAIINENNTDVWGNLKLLLNPRKFALAFGGIAVILTIGFIIYSGLGNYSNNSEISVLLNKSFKNERPTEARITGFDFAPKIEGTRGNTDKTQDLNFVSAKSRAVEAVLKNETAGNLHALGRVYLAEQNFDEAVKQFEKALKKKPNAAELHNDLGAALIEKAKQKEEGQLELFARANEEITKAIELNKNLTEAYFNRGLVIELLNLPNQAREAWENYLKLDSSSQWAEEAREHLRKIETDKSVSKTKEEILREFLQAKQANDAEKAWQTLSRNRETITGKLIPQQLAFLFIDGKTIGDEAKSKEALDALIYVGELEEEKSGDLFWRDLAEFYKNVSVDKIPKLKQAQDSVRKGYDFCLQSNFKDAFSLFSESQNLFESSSNLPEAKISQHFAAYCLVQTDKINESIGLRKQIEEFTAKKNYKWLELTNLFRMGGDFYELNRYSLAEEKYKQSLTLAGEIEDDYSLQRILSELAVEKSIFKETGEALNYLQKVLLLSNKNVSKRQYWRNLTTSIRILSRANFLDTAKVFSAETISLSDELNDPIFMTNARLYLGQINSQTEDFIEADRWLNEAKQKADEIRDEKLRANRAASIILADANLNRKQGNLENSIILYQKALETYNKTQFSLNMYETQKGLLLSYSKLKRDSDLEKQIPLVLELAKINRQQILSEQQRNSFFDNEQDVYDIGIEYEFNKANFTNAFDYSEESRSRSLLDLQNSVVQVSTDEKQPEIKFSSNLSEPLKLTQIQSEMSENTKYFHKNQSLQLANFEKHL